MNEPEIFIICCEASFESVGLDDAGKMKMLDFLHDRERVEKCLFALTEHLEAIKENMP